MESFDADDYSAEKRETAPDANDCRAGFTLIELMVVMVVLAALTTVAIPKIRNALFFDPLKSSARRLIGLINETALKARAEQDRYVLSFSPDRQTVSATKASASREDSVPTVMQCSDTVRVVDIISVHGGNTADGTLILPFSSKGYVDRSLIHLQDGEGRELTLSLSPFLAVVRVFEGSLTLEDDRLQW